MPEAITIDFGPHGRAKLVIGPTDENGDVTLETLQGETAYTRTELRGMSQHDSERNAVERAMVAAGHWDA